MSSIEIYKEKKEKDYRLVIMPVGKNEIGLWEIKNYGIISFLELHEEKKIGELVLLFLNEDENELVKNKNRDFAKSYFGCSWRKVATNYDLLSFEKIKDSYILQLNKKDGLGFSPLKNVCYTFEKLPTAYELGKKIKELFEYKN